MNKYLLGGAAAAAIFVAGAAFAQTAQPMQPAPGAKLAKTQARADVQAHVARMFAALDSNRDGFITKDEVAAGRTEFMGRMRPEQRRPGFDRSDVFDRLDVNCDGVISRDEFAAAPRAHFGTPMAGMHGGFAARMFETADVNKDGRVSLAEAQQAALQRFDRADLNRDGRLTPDERRQARQMLRGHRPPS